MNYYRHATAVLTIVGLTGTAAKATADEGGPTSRDSISISISIPPHFEMNPAGSSTHQGRVAKSDLLCIEGNGAKNYHVAVVGPEGLPDRSNTLRQSRLIPIAIDPATCGPGTAAAAIHFANWLSTSPGSARAPVTLLIIPD